MVYCPGCGTANRDGSRFCNECGTKLPTMTSSLCPTCGTPNPPHSLFCEKCGTRLIASLAEELEEPETSAPVPFVPKGLSLPTKSVPGSEAPSAAPTSSESRQPVEPVKPTEEDLPDWMQIVQSSMPDTSELGTVPTSAPSDIDQPVAEEAPAWASQLGLTDQSADSKKPTTDELLPEWAQRLRTLPETAPSSASEEDIPDWLSALGKTGQLPSNEDLPAAPTSPASAEMPAWMSDLGGPVEPAGDEELPEWLKEPTTPYFSSEPEPPAPTPPAAQTHPASDEMPDWLRDLRPVAGAEESLPDWLDELGGEEHPTSESKSLSTGDSALDWLSQLSATAPEPEPPSTQPAGTSDWMSSFRTAASEPEAPADEGVPDWLKGAGLGAAGAAAVSGMQEEPPAEPAASYKPVTDWLSALRQSTPEVEPEPASSEAEVPDWMSTLGTAETPAATQADEGVPDWLKGAGLAAAGAAVVGSQEKPSETPISEKPPTDWLSSLRQATPEMETEQPAAAEVPDWMSALGSEETPSATQADEGVPDWLKGAGLAAAGAAVVGSQEKPSETPASKKPPTDWLSSLRQATPEMETEQPADEIPDWMSVVGAEESSATDEAGIPDWLKDTSTAATGAAIVGSQKEPPLEAEKPATDWLSSLRQATPEMEAEQSAAEEIPEWMRDENEVAPQSIGGPQAYEQEIPDWLREADTSYQATEEQPATQAEESTVPDWLKGFGAAAAGAAAFTEEQPEESVPQKSPSDWLSSLREATPEIEAEQSATEEVPEWMRDETGVAPQAIGGPQAYEQDVPDWLRETGAVAASPSSQVEEDNVPDWLREETGAALPSTAQSTIAQPEEESGVPDWLKGLGGAAAVGAAAASRAEEPSGEEPSNVGLPDWLQQETMPQAQPEASDIPDWLRAAEPKPAISFEEPPAEESEPEESLEWLHELTPAEAGAAMVPAEPEIEEPEEVESAEEAAEAESETEGGILAAATLAAGVAGAVRRSEKEETPPAEMPDWLKEISQEQQVSQQVARKAIPVPPSEVTGLAQAEIPAWLQALRPTEEAETSKEAAPLEVEGPLAGIANALPPAPVMGEIQGPAAKLQFVVSAEDQARAGILRELLTQHAVAPAAVEQFVVKGSVIRRRAIRWTVAVLIIIALLVPIGNDLEGILPLLKVKDIIPPPNVRAAAFQISQLAQLPPDSKVLVVFDYDSTQAGELDRVAQALLQSPALRNVQINTASLNPQGSSLAQRVLTDLPDLKHTDLGFFPGQVSGVQALLAQAGDAKLIIDLAASPETVRWWAEQLKASHLNVPLLAGVSAGAESLTMPYVQSGQVKGLVSGFPDAVAYLKATGMTNTYSQLQVKKYQVPLDGLTLANYVMVGLIIAGVIGAVLRGRRRRSA